MKSPRRLPKGSRVLASALLVYNSLSGAASFAAGVTAPVRSSGPSQTVAGRTLSQSTLSHLMVSAGSVRILNASNSSVLKFAGNIQNQGTLYVVSTNPQSTNAALVAQNIVNLPGGTITTVLPASGVLGITIPNAGGIL